MSSLPKAGRRSETGRSERFHRWRKTKDRIARWSIALGGIGVIVAVVLILFYLVWVVFPLFLPAQAEGRALGERPAWQGETTVFLALEEQLEVGLRIDRSGAAEFFTVPALAVLDQAPLLEPAAGGVVAVAEDLQGRGLLALAAQDGRVRLVQHAYRTDFSDGVAKRRIVPALERPFGEHGFELGAPARALTLSDTDRELVIAALAGGRLLVQLSAKRENFLTGEVELEPRRLERELAFEPTALAVAGNHRWIYVGGVDGRIRRFDLPGLEPSGETDLGSPVTAMTMLLGGISVLAGDTQGRITQLFPVREAGTTHHLEAIRAFRLQDSPITRLQSEYRRKGFLALDAAGNLGIYHSTAGQQALELRLGHSVGPNFAVSPRADGLLSVGPGGAVRLWDLDNPHPEISFAALWSRVWYENYPEPSHIWQSSAASNDFEPKFSLTPLAFGTLKAALYAMLFAVPLALMGSAFTAYFMAPRMRRLVKPTIEIMAALPTVILGFLAGLWFAPFLEENLAGVFAIALVVPLGLFAFAYAWSQLGGGLRALVPEGWEPALLMPVMAALVWASLQLTGPIEGLLFGGDLRGWINNELGLAYDQRNAMVVGVAMGFAVIPTIFSISEDAVYGVPQSLSDGSLALGATRWQTLVRVILPTASPGIFSALMIGLGRAVGETMIVLMATGNTPIMDWNVFEGMRTLAANIAVEMPESEVNSSHYRILFLAALVLFAFTFVVNTGAEIVRQRLRVKYSSL